MKRSKIIPGLVALLLAGAGAFASISQPQQTAYYEQIEGESASCTQFQTTVDCEPSQTPDCREVVPALGDDRQLYSDSGCEEPLERESGF